MFCNDAESAGNSASSAACACSNRGIEALINNGLDTDNELDADSIRNRELYRTQISHGSVIGNERLHTAPAPKCAATRCLPKAVIAKGTDR